MQSSLADLSEYVWLRTINRLEGLTDEEYLWEPVKGCWSIRAGSDGVLRPDWAAFADPPPFTNVAWRLCHLIACYGAGRNREWLGVSSAGAPSFESTDPAPTTAGAALETLRAAHDEWAAVLGSMTDATLAEKLGPIAGQYAESDKAGFVIHMLDEFIHHGAELALLRDLWRDRARFSG
jgi:hypothetical protein